jgi:hypothetical protein
MMRLIHCRVADILPLHSSMGSKYIHQRWYRTFGPPMSVVAYWWCSRTYMSWLVYLQKMYGMFCRVLKKDYYNSVTFGTKRWVRSLHLKNRPQKGPFTSFNYDEISPCWEQIGQISLKIVTSVKFHLIVLRPPGRDITSQARIVWRMTICIGLSKWFCYLFLATTIYAISCTTHHYKYGQNTRYKQLYENMWNENTINPERPRIRNPREKLNVLMYSIQHLLIYNNCNHMLDIADLNTYLYQ